MTISIQISDADYREMISRGCRLRGSIGLTNTTEATFNRHHDACRYNRAREYRFQKLTHGRVSITDERVRLTLNIDRNETDICPSESIDIDSAAASDFVFRQIEEG